LIDWYRCRWEIETLFHVLKNGCRVEALQLGEIKKLEVAWRSIWSSPGVWRTWCGWRASTRPARQRGV
jgi:hypothetical protein